MSPDDITKNYDLLAEAGCICRHLEYDQYPELHLYIIAQKAAEVPGREMAIF